MHKRLATALLISAVTLTNSAIAHMDADEPLQSYRQSWFALIGANTNPLFAMLKGEAPWDEKRLAAYSKQLATLANMEYGRGFAKGSEKGKTRAKPDIWENREDFKAKMQDLRDAANALEVAVSGGNRKVISGSIAALGKSCKSCHDEYKSKDYLY